MPTKRKKLSPHQRLVRAAKAGKGIRLSADEVFVLGSLDDAIVMRARNDDDVDEGGDGDLR